MKNVSLKKWKIMGMMALIAAVLVPTAVMFSANASQTDEASRDIYQYIYKVTASDVNVTSSDTDGSVSLYDLIDHDISWTHDLEPQEPVQIEKYFPKKYGIIAAPSPNTAYDGSYHSELSAGGLDIYNSIYEHFAVQKQSANLKLDLSSNVNYRREWPTVDSNIPKNEIDSIVNDMRDALAKSVIKDTYGAGCAFMYDNPQIFWIGNMYPYQYSVGTDEDGMFIKYVTVGSVEYYPEAYSQMPAFQTGVDQAVKSINDSLPANATTYQKIKAVHDYICDKAYYDYAAIEASDFTPYWYTQTAAPIFVDDPKVFVSGNNYFVCAGYAKSFKVLADRLGLEACTIVGVSVNTGHAWNYVRAENGVWYAVDVTWDDSTRADGTSVTYYSYFMVGSQKFVKLHTADPYLSCMSSNAFKFEFPRLSYSDYQVSGTCQHDYELTCTNEVEPTCSSDGYSGDWYCSNCNTLVYQGEKLKAVPHEFEFVYNDDATCISDGTKTEKCKNCGAEGNTYKVSNSKKSHDYSILKYIDDEYHGKVCSFCGETCLVAHSGGTASYDTKAVCEECNHEYGNYLELDMKLNMSAITLAIGDKFTPDVYRYPSSCEGTVTWNSSNEAVATVDSNGAITAVSKGKADITADLYYCTAVIKVSVVAEFKKPTTDIVINKPEITLEIMRSKPNPTASLSAKITGTTTGKTWYSDNINVATVTSSGKVTAISEGTANIYCRTAEGKTSAPCVVKVTPCRIDSDNMRENMVYVSVGRTCKLKLTSTINHGAVTWKSSNPKVATIDGYGNVVGLAKGTVTVTATMGDKSKDTVKLVVVTPDLYMSLKSQKESIYIGSSVTFKTVSGTKGSNDPVFWSSSNTAIATVNSKGVVKGIRQGVVTITGKAYGGRILKATVIVHSKATAIEFTEVTPALYASNKTGQFSVKITSPSNCNDTVTWTSSNKKVATISNVSADGKTITITSGSSGTSTITAKTGSGKKVTYKFTCVNSPAESVTLNMYSADIYVGKNVTLKAKAITPKGCNDIIVWKSDDTSIATVDQNGKVVGVAPGTVTIQADSFGGVKNSVKVTVRSKATEIEFTDVTPALYENNKTGQFSVQITSPSNCNDTVTWTSSNKKVATISNVSADGKTITITSGSSGTSTITAKTGSGKKITYKFTCVNSPAESVTLNMYSADIYVGKNVTLKAKTITPKGCNDIIVWKSDNTSIATVDQNGKVVGVAPGTVTIQADSFGGVKNSVKVTVRSKATEILVDNDAITVRANETAVINVSSIAPEGCNDKITWTSSSNSIATVTASNDGKRATVQGIKKGTATVTVKTGSGKYTKVKVIVTD